MCVGFSLLVNYFALKKKGGVPETRVQCEWIALQDPAWINIVIVALKREKSGKSSVTCDMTAVIEKKQNGKEFMLQPQAKLSGAAILEWDKRTNVSGSVALELSSERVRPRTESCASDMGDTRSSRSNGVDDVA
jgi:hypothetical protein